MPQLPPTEESTLKQLQQLPLPHLRPIGPLHPLNIISCLGLPHFIPQWPPFPTKPPIPLGGMNGQHPQLQEVLGTGAR